MTELINIAVNEFEVFRSFQKNICFTHRFQIILDDSKSATLALTKDAGW